MINFTHFFCIWNNDTCFKGDISFTQIKREEIYGYLEWYNIQSSSPDQIRTTYDLWQSGLETTGPSLCKFAHYYSHVINQSGSTLCMWSRCIMHLIYLFSWKKLLSKICNFYCKIQPTISKQLDHWCLPYVSPLTL